VVLDEARVAALLLDSACTVVVSGSIVPQDYGQYN
jgi:hypothetical protein